MKLDIKEIAAFLDKQISQPESFASLEEVGEVLTVGDGVARIYGLDNVQAGEMVEFTSGVRGLALNLEHSSVGVESISCRECARVDGNNVIQL